VGAEGNGLKAMAASSTISEIGSGHSIEAFIKTHLSRAGEGDFIAICQYIRETPEHEELIQAIRSHLRDSTRTATTTGYGPRFLHSTGQLHKGGAASGVFLQITAEDAEDVTIPNEPYTFGVLKQAQALGDFQSLESRNRRAVRIHLGEDVAGGLRKLLDIVHNVFPISQGQAR
ncbi:MAG TPA: transaldolase, partial [Blastocatellia bacterium]|nr:transaldolase [Blastocatellia bacterium]